MATQPRHLRADDLPDIPVPDHLSGYELVNGELVPVTPSRLPHAGMLPAVAGELRSYVRQHKLGRVYVDVWVKLPQPRDPERVRAPDIAFYAANKVEKIRGTGIPRLPPDLVVEIFSPSNERKRSDFDQRIRDYLDAGVTLIWVIYPSARYATVIRNDGSARIVRENEQLDGEDVIPGLMLSLQELLSEAE